MTPLFLSMDVDGTKNNRVRSTVGSVRLIYLMEAAGVLFLIRGLILFGALGQSALGILFVISTYIFLGEVLFYFL